MISVEIRFLTGKYHATPWDKQVNEGVVEWPPSPWRILRALIFTWYHKAQGEIIESTIRNLVEKLSSPPSFSLPPVSLGHTRHYMPLYDVGKTAKIFDAFAIVDERPLYITWPDVDATEEERNALNLLLLRLGYMGRAESWVEARLIEDAQTQPNSLPLKDGELPQNGYESIRTLVCTSSGPYIEWRNGAYSDHIARKLEELRAKAREKGKPDENVKLKKSDEEQVAQNIPADIFSALQIDTGDMKYSGWNQPPGSIWINYTRPKNCFDISPNSKIGRMYVNDENPTVARFAVYSSAPPRLTDTVSLTDRIHKALVKISEHSCAFTGCDENGAPLKGNKHAFIMCESNVGFGKGMRGEITHVSIYSLNGFKNKERVALEKLTKVWGHGGHDVQLILLGVGKPSDFGGIEEDRGKSPILACSNVWISRTPFISTRHSKTSKAGVPKTDENGIQIGSPEHDLRRLLHEMNFPEPIKIERVGSMNLAGHETRWIEFKRERHGGDGRSAGYNGYGFRIVFNESVKGPIALGYGAHFGLGLFVPEKDNNKLQNPQITEVPKCHSKTHL
jgi:CRISPR-associated protein Csb2